MINRPDISNHKTNTNTTSAKVNNNVIQFPQLGSKSFQKDKASLGHLVKEWITIAPSVLEVHGRKVGSYINQLYELAIKYKSKIFYQSDDYMAKKCGVSTRTFQRHKANLVSMQVCTISKATSKNGNHITQYHLNDKFLEQTLLQAFPRLKAEPKTKTGIQLRQNVGHIILDNIPSNEVIYNNSNNDVRRVTTAYKLREVLARKRSFTIKKRFTMQQRDAYRQLTELKIYPTFALIAVMKLDAAYIIELCCQASHHANSGAYVFTCLRKAIPHIKNKLYRTQVILSANIPKNITATQYESSKQLESKQIPVDRYRGQQIELSRALFERAKRKGGRIFQAYKMQLEKGELKLVG